MLDNNTYNKVKILHSLSCLLWFIKNHALPDAHVRTSGQYHELLAKLEQDLSKHIDVFKNEVCKQK